MKKAEVAASNAMQDVQNYTAAAAAASLQPAWMPKQPSADQGTRVMLGCNAMCDAFLCQVYAEPTDGAGRFRPRSCRVLQHVCSSVFTGCHVTARQAFHISLRSFQTKLLTATNSM